MCAMCTLHLHVHIVHIKNVHIVHITFTCAHCAHKRCAQCAHNVHIVHIDVHKMCSKLTLTAVADLAEIRSSAQRCAESNFLDFCSIPSFKSFDFCCKYDFWFKNPYVASIFFF